VKEFITAVVEAHDPEEAEDGWSIKLDDREMKFYKPTDGQFAIYMATTGKFASDQQRMAAMIDMFVNVFDKEDQVYIIERMLNREDPLPMETVQEMIEYMVEEWTGRPTQPSSVSTPSRKNGGRKSTRTIQGSISSDSQATGS